MDLMQVMVGLLCVLVGCGGREDRYRGAGGADGGGTDGGVAEVDAGPSAEELCEAAGDTWWCEPALSWSENTSLYEIRGPEAVEPGPIWHGWGGVAADRDDGAYAIADDGRFASFSPDGALRWEIDLVPESGTIAQVTGPVRAPDGAFYVRANDLARVEPDGTVSWVLPGVFASQLLPTEHGVVAFDWGSMRNETSVFHVTGFRDDGTTAWSIMRETPYVSSAEVVQRGAGASDARVYFATDDAVLHALDAETGAVVWEMPVDPVSAPPAVSPEGTVYLPAGDHLIALDDAGRELWRWRDDAAPWLSSAPVLAQDGGVVIASALAVVSIGADGATRWTSMVGEFDPAGASRQPSIAPDGTIYAVAGRYDTVLYALDPGGEVAWQAPLPELAHTALLQTIVPAGAAGGRVYVAAGNRLLGITRACGCGGCVPASCLDAPVECGSVPDGCGGTLDCGGCGELATCGVTAEHACAVSSGADPSRTIGSLSPDELRRMCEWSAEAQGGGGRTIDCGGGTTITLRTVDECVERAPGFAGCTVETFEACSLGFRDDPCGAATSPACYALMRCAG